MMTMTAGAPEDRVPQAAGSLKNIPVVKLDTFVFFAAGSISR